MDAGVFCVAGVGAHFFFLAVFAVDAVMQLRHVGGGVHAVLRQEGHVGVDCPCMYARLHQTERCGTGIQNGCG